MMRGCEEGTVKQGEPFPFAPELARCPWSVIEPVAFELVSMFERYRRLGVLPFGVERVGDMPQYMVEAFEAAADAEAFTQAMHAGRVEQALARALAVIPRVPTGENHGA